MKAIIIILLTISNAVLIVTNQRARHDTADLLELLARQTRLIQNQESQLNIAFALCDSIGAQRDHAIYQKGKYANFITFIMHNSARGNDDGELISHFTIQDMKDILKPDEQK